jgi:hypothetical protein
MLSQNGRHYPQSRNWSPEIQLKSSTIRLARNRPDGPPYCGHEVMKPRCASVFARDQRRATADAHAPSVHKPWNPGSWRRSRSRQAEIRGGRLLRRGWRLQLRRDGPDGRHAVAADPIAQETDQGLASASFTLACGGGSDQTRRGQSRAASSSPVPGRVKECQWSRRGLACRPSSARRP